LQKWLQGGPSGRPPRADPLDGSFLERDPGRWRRRDDAFDLAKLADHLAQVAAGLIERFGEDGLGLGDWFTVGITNDAGRYGGWLELTQPLELASTESFTLALQSDPAERDEQGAPRNARLTILLARIDAIASGGVELDPEVRLHALGVRIGGPGSKPLLGGSTVRAGALALYGGHPGPGAWSVAIEAEQLAIGLGAAGDGNAVAKNLLAPPAGSAGAPGDASPAVPAVDTRLVVRPGSDGNPAVSIAMRAREVFPLWVPIQRSFGPLHIEQVGVDLDPRPGDGQPLDLGNLGVAVLVDGGLTLGPLAAAVDNLRVAIKLATPSPENWQISVDGFAISANQTAFSLAGGLRRPPAGAGDYLGFLTLRFGAYGLSLFGGYGRYPQNAPTFTALFVFGALKAPLGGPPPFFLTGVGAGVGINRQLRTPDIKGILDHPMVQALDRGFRADAEHPEQLTGLSNQFPAAHGSYWIAAGVSFTTFAFIESVAVLAVQFDPGGFEINLLGLTRFSLPAGQTAIVNLEILLSARYSNRDNALLVQASFSPNSWLVSPDCRITGGIAIGMWFNTGDFVVSLGGYHPDFPVPDHYPRPDRLGVRWRPAEGVAIVASGYFALTPRAVMTGASLAVTVDRDWYGLSLTAYFDALLQWDPFRYLISIGIEISGWAQLGPVYVSIGTGAHVTLNGPPLYVEGYVDLGLIRIPFAFGGPPGGGRKPLDWTTFEAKYVRGTGQQPRPRLGATVGTGRLGENDTPGTSQDPWRVAPQFSIVTRTALPCTSLNGRSEGDQVGAPALWVSAYQAEHQVHLRRRDGQPVSQLPTIVPVIEAQPVAAWGSFQFDALTAGRLDGDDLTVDAVAGALIRTEQKRVPVLRARAGAFEFPLDLPSPFAVVEATTGGPSFGPPPARRSEPPGVPAGPVPAATPPAATPAPVALQLEVVAAAPPAAHAPQVGRTTVGGQPDLPRRSVPDLADAVVRAGAAGIRVEVTGQPGPVAAVTVTGLAAVGAAWRADDPALGDPPPTLVGGDLATGAVVSLAALSVWRAGSSGAVRWTATAPCRVVVIGVDGSIEADQQGERGLVAVAAGAKVAVTGATTPAGPLVAGWAADDPVLWLDPVTGIVPGGILRVVGAVDRPPGAYPIGVPLAGTVLALAAAGVRSVGLVIDADATGLPAGLRLEVPGSGLDPIPQIVASPDGATALVWGLDPPGSDLTQVVLVTIGQAAPPVRAVLAAGGDPNQLAATLVGVPSQLLTGTAATLGSVRLDWDADE
jgi:hypothetical protein